MHCGVFAIHIILYSLFFVCLFLFVFFFVGKNPNASIPEITVSLEMKKAKRSPEKKYIFIYEGTVVAAIDHGGVAIRPSNNMCMAGSKHFNETF